MMNQFSPKVSEILSFSREEAERLASTSVGPEHILLGILREKNSPVKDLFDTMHIDIESLKNSLEERVRQKTMDVCFSHPTCC
jgi:ATP-dependent Clp protease ATP-binding subunit ClpC